MKKWLPKVRLLTLFSFMALLLAGCGEPFVSALSPAGEVAKMQFDLMILATLIMVIVIAVVTIIFIIALVKFRRSKVGEDKIPKQVEGNHTLEIIWTTIPILLLLILAIPTVSATFKLADVKAMEQDKDAVVVNVTANLYWWEFEYPGQGVVTAQELVVPMDEKVYFNLIAADVKHSFWIPAAGGKMDTNTDNVNKFWLEFDSESTEEAGGLLYGKCAELCGPSHALMDFKVKPVPRAEFDQWMDKMVAAKDAEHVPANDVAKAGEELFTSNGCISCHAINPGEKRPTAPSLANFGDRSSIAGKLEFNKDNLKDWLKDPESIKPGNNMTGTYDNKGLSDQDLDALAEYLMGLKIEE
ncbi:cytochrome c oxidase subunit II [Bacillus timonensis]|uniref:Cytochrome c oxidase subunit 2 n=1 Tax=Bacillus timonensis TaxID=1033734 RepID=A0A4V3V898_9BACI|nr:cytochrome c oxidase subunit II [Bacillus timonensis]THE14343.1 cytochrome c oxidase subunit II [Bacillus timonensis]